ncbi:VOC family protein [Leucothrix arctica]|uniref:VOC domain-containing protein n=1 Tax=Leucothrix arctica TaxID=1481894 RepID=A0A317C7Z6_9GAMM|nr:VOC family protein [Leucothrix arctica]PWQ94736.1 hypothetical protein DKT75_15735 [Leucothrix arctica]
MAISESEDDMKIKRLLTNICSQDLAQSKAFYISLFAFKVDFDSDWFVHLVSEGRELELGLILQSHEVVPEQAKASITGAYLTFVIDDVDRFYKKAQGLDVNILQAPEMTPYGQKRMLLQAPEGTVCDVSSPVNV